MKRREEKKKFSIKSNNTLCQKRMPTVISCWKSTFWLLCFVMAYCLVRSSRLLFFFLVSNYSWSTFIWTLYVPFLFCIFLVRDHRALILNVESSLVNVSSLSHRSYYFSRDFHLHIYVYSYFKCDSIQRLHINEESDFFLSLSKHRILSLSHLFSFACNTYQRYVFSVQTILISFPNKFILRHTSPFILVGSIL